jgi:8-oxo-dGTP diphosphatase
MEINKETLANEEVLDYIKNGYKTFLSYIAVECVIFTYEERQLKVLLYSYQDLGWSLPGGQVKHEEPIAEAASRILKSRTSLDNVFLKQFHTFGDGPFRVKYVKSQNTNIIPDDSWFATRKIGIGYYALIDSLKAQAISPLLGHNHSWFDINEVPDNIGMDYAEIIKTALVSLRHDIFREPIGYELLPEKFTLPEIQTLYETILDKKFDRRNFPNKLLSLGIIKKLDEKRNIGQHRSPFLYMLNRDNYQEF